MNRSFYIYETKFEQKGDVGMAETNTERLAELKLAPKYPATIKDFGIVNIYKEDFDWLIQQAEKAQDLQNIRSNVAIAHQANLEFLGIENNRLREALKNACNSLGADIEDYLSE